MQARIKREVVENILFRNNQKKEHMAVKLGITGAYFSSLLSGNAYPSAELRDKIMSALDITVWEDIFEEV